MTADSSDLIRRIAARFRDHPVLRFLDFRIAELTPGRSVMSIRLKPEFDNGTGAIHGGVLAMLADTAAAVALSTSYGGETPFATSTMNIHFLRRASTGITATATIIKEGSKVCVATVELHDAEKRQVATATCDFVLLTGRE